MNDIVAIAFVQGTAYSRMAQLSIPRAIQVLEMDVKLRIVPETDNLWLAKLSFIEEFSVPVLCFDVDMVFCGWDWSHFNLDSFNAVLDYPLRNWRHGARVINQFYPVESAINAGLWYAPPTDDVRAMFRRARELFDELQNHQLGAPLRRLRAHAFGDQSALNSSIFELKQPINLLPHSFNYQVPTNSPLILPPNTYVGHAIGQSLGIDGKTPNLPEKQHRLMQMLEKNPPWQRRGTAT